MKSKPNEKRRYLLHCNLVPQMISLRTFFTYRTSHRVTSWRWVFAHWGSYDICSFFSLRHHSLHYVTRILFCWLNLVIPTLEKISNSRSHLHYGANRRKFFKSSISENNFYLRLSSMKINFGKNTANSEHKVNGKGKLVNVRYLRTNKQNLFHFVYFPFNRK